MDNMNQLQDPAFQRAYAKFQQIAPILEQMQTQRTQAAQQERVAPVTNALASLGNQWKAATTDEGRNQAESLADKTRAAYITGGGSPTDISQQYWGSDPMQGFKTTTGYQAPITGYEGLDRDKTVDYTRDAIAAELKRRIDEAGLTGIDPQTGQKTWDRTYKEMMYNKPTGGSGGGGGSTKAPPSLYDQAKAAAYNDPRLFMGKAEDAPEGTYTLDALISAWMGQLPKQAQQAAGGGGGVVNGITDADILQYLK